MENDSNSQANYQILHSSFFPFIGIIRLSDVTSD